MKINKSTCITGKNVILVPYREYHVLRYHEWMKSEELQYFTASEPLTLDQEHEMQKSWLEDENKCTFIILNKLVFQRTSNEIESMIGDTNLFLNDVNNEQCAEVEIMIAEQTERRKKYGWEAVILMLLYGIEKLNVKKYFAKISINNQKSMNMFHKLKFKEVSKSNIFKEITLIKEVDDEWIEWLINETPESVRVENYI